MSSSSRVPRYPRWGYVDKFEISPYLMRSVLVTVGVYLAALAAFAVWERLARVAPVVRRNERPVPVLIAPLPPKLQFTPTLPTARPGPRVVVRKSEFTMPVPVPDELVEPEPIAPATPGTGSPGAVTDGSIPESIGNIDGLMQAPPDPHVFVAVEVEPKLVFIDQPVYPELAREAGVSGDVLVRVLVGVDGHVLQAFVLQSVPVLDEAALAAARTAVFKPALQSGQPVAVWVNVPISFQLYE